MSAARAARLRRVRFASALLACALLGMLVHARAEPPSSGLPPSTPDLARPLAERFDVRDLGHGVYAVLRRDVAGLAVESNNAFIVGDDDVIVVDTPSNPATTRAVIAALRRITDKPVRYVVNTHGHDDHVAGLPLYRTRDPGLAVVARTATRDYLAGAGRENHRAFHASLPGTLDALARMLNDGKGLAGTPLTAEERESLRSDITFGEAYLSVGAAFEAPLPTITFDDRLTLWQGSRRIDLVHVGRGHTAGDIVVHLPAERIVFGGDLVVAPVPLIGVPQSYVAEWGDALRRLLALDAAVIVPGHGPLLTDDRYVGSLATLMDALRDRTAVAAKDGAPLNDVRRRVDLADLRRRFAGDSALLGALFAIYVEGPGVESAWRAATSPK